MSLNTKPGRFFVVIGLVALSCSGPAQGDGLPLHVPIDMTQWNRRDWDECDSNVKQTPLNGGVRIVSDHAAALFWQIPTTDGSPIPLDPAEFDWLNRCERPPRSLNDDIDERADGRFLNVADYPYVTWRWMAEEATLTEQKVKNSGRLRKKYDDFPNKIGISILKKDSDTIREVAYVWSKILPKASMFTSETTIIPLIWKLKSLRYVLQSGVRAEPGWVSENRNLYEDYKAGYPGEEPGRILRVYIMTDSDNTESRATGSYANIVFHRQTPGN